jgi:multidrug efflux pump subunit AcrA (membrane-fusion protein)
VITPEHDSTVVLPLTAIYAPTTGKNYVWVVDSRSRVQRREVVIGNVINRESVEILSGLEPGARVVTAGVYKLADNQKVHIINQDL